MRVVFICPSLEIGGAERQVAVLVPALRQRGIDASVVTIRGRGPFFEQLASSGVDVQFVPVSSRFDIAGVRRVLRALPPTDLVVTQSLDAQLVGALAARTAHVPHVTVHHKQPELVPSLHRRALMRLVARKTDLVVAVTEAQLHDIVRLGTPSERVTVIANGVPEPSLSRPAGEVRRELGVGDADILAVLAATLRPEKRVEVFVRAVEEAHAADARIRGVVAGGGPQLEQLRALGRNRRVVDVIGPRHDLADVLAAADVVCLTSGAEALPMVILEAMSLSKPVVATRVGGIPSVVQHGVTGVLTDVDDGGGLRDALLELARDPARRRMLGAAGRSRYELGYSSELMADRFAELFQRLVRRGS